MPKPFANSPQFNGDVIESYILGIQIGTDKDDSGLPQMMYVSAKKLRSFMREGMASVYNYRGGYSSLPTDLANGDTFYATTTFTEGGITYSEGHLYAWNGTSWDDITDIFTQYAKQGDLDSLTEDVDAIDERLAQAEAEIEAFAGGIVFKGETTSANLPSPSTSNKGWMYYVTDLGTYKVSDGTQWVNFGSYPIEAYALRSSFPVTGEGQKLYIAEDEKKLYWWDGSAYVSDTEKMAEIDGYYQEMTVGDAEQLVATQVIEEEALYSFRTSGGNVDIGNRSYDKKIVGGTINWGQLAKIEVRTGSSSLQGQWQSYNNTSILTADVSTKTIHVKDGSTSDQYRDAVALVSVTRSRYVYFRARIKNNYTDRSITYAIEFVQSGGSSASYGSWHTLSANSEATISGLVQATSDKYIAFIGVAMRDSSGIGLETTIPIDIIEPNVFGLDSMFGSAIAGYVSTLETSQAGSGIAWLKSHGFLTKPYYSYSAPTLQSVNVSAHKMTGFNQCNEIFKLGRYSADDGTFVTATDRLCSEDYISIIGGKEYYFRMGSASSDKKFSNVCWYDGNMNFLSAETNFANTILTAPDEARYALISITPEYGTTYKNDICINISWSGTRNGEYEPYEEHTYPYDESVILRGIPKLDANNNLYYDGDEYASDGTVTRKMSTTPLQLSSLTWSIYNSGKKVIGAKIPTMKGFSAKVVCNRYSYQSPITASSQLADKCISTYQDSVASESTTIALRDTTNITSTTIVNPLAFLEDVYVIYELASPITETADPFTEVQFVNDWGTEEFIDVGVEAGTRDVAIPVYAFTDYPANLRDKVQHLPNLANGDGEYVIKQKGSQMELVPTDNLKKDEYYPTLAVGTADNLRGKGTVGAEITFRPSGGADADIGSGVARLDKIKGNSVNRNQLCPNNTTTGNGYTRTSTTITITDPTTTDFNMSACRIGVNTITGHKYLYRIISNTTYLFLRNYYTGTGNIYCNNGKVVSETHGYNICLGFLQGIEAGTYNLQIIVRDLTIIFGAGNEPTLAQIQSNYPELLEYSDYDAGSTDSFVGTGLETDGFNQWDEEWEVGRYNNSTGQKEAGSLDRIRSKNFIPILPSTNYYLHCGSSLPTFNAYFYDLNKNFIEYYVAQPQDTVFQTPSNAFYMTFFTGQSYGNAYKHDICINLSWSGIRNGEFEEYWKSVLNLPITTVTGKRSGSDTSEVIFPDGMNRASADNYDVLTNKTAKVATLKVDMGTLSWQNYATGIFIADLPNCITAINTTKFVCGRYAKVNSATDMNSGDKCCGLNLNGYSSVMGRFYVKDSAFNSSTTAQFKSAMSGIYLVYALKTPVEYTLDEELNLNYRVDDFGTEKLLPTTGTVPLLADIAYAMNAVDQLRRMPVNYDNTASLDNLCASLSTALSNALNGTFTITRGAYDENTQTYAFNVSFTPNA